MSARELSSAPPMWQLYPRAFVGAGISAVRRLPGVPAPRGLPGQELVLAGIEIDREHVAAYDRVCTFELRDRLPPTYPHLLAFPLSMKLMTDHAFPFAVMGLVHVRNRIWQRLPLEVGDRPTMRVGTARLEAHERGTQFDVVAEAEVAGEVAWRSASTYLHRESDGGSGGRRREGTERPGPSMKFAVPDDIGRRYAAVSGDRNPIHLHPLAARLFGLPRHIAHGMWAKARCLAILGDAVPERCEIDVSFKLPLTLPGRVALASRTEGRGLRFALDDAESAKPHLAGAIEPL